MDDIPVSSKAERSAPSRVVEIRGAGAFGSGYAVTADLVLTARHCLDPESDTCRVRRLGDSGWRDATVVWRGSGSVDAALVRVSGVPWGDDPHAWWTRWAVPSGDGVPCTAWGFPRSQRREDESGRPVRDVETVTGWIDSVTGFKMNRYSLNILAPHPQARADSEWRGMSGAVLCAGTDRDRRAGQLLGVVTTDPAAYGGRRLEAVGVAVLLHDPEFARLVGAGPSDVEEVTADPVPLLDRMLRDPFDTLPSDASDWWRLQSRFAEVPFLGRDDALRRLTSWCLDVEPVAPRFSIGLITGDGGSGKTRLAGQLCVDVRAKGWAAGFCGAETLTRLRSQGERPDAARPTLVVVDYPEPLITMIAGLVTGLAVRDHGPPVRLLLVARDGPAADRDNWWKQLTDATGGYLSGDRPHVVELDDEPLSLVERAMHFRAALAAFGGGMNVPAPPSLDDPAYGNTLRLHLAVLLACRGEDVAAADGVLRQFLRHETKQWCHDWLVHRHAPVTGATTEPLPPVTAAERQALLCAVAAVALIAPHRDRLPEMLATLPGTPGPEDAAWLAGLFPATDETVAFGPDILTATLLDTVEDLPGLVEALYTMFADSASDLTRLLDALQLAASHARVEAALAALVTDHFPDLVQRALTDPDTALSDTVTGVLRLLCRDPSRSETLAALAVNDAVPSHGHLVLRTALGDLRVTGLREAEEPVDPAALAGQLSDLATHAAELGRHSEAAERALEAVATFEQAGVTGEDYALAAHNTAAALLAIDQPRRAMEYAKKAVEALPEDAVGARLEAGVTVLANRLAVGEPTGDVVSGLQRLADFGVVDKDFDEMLDGLASFAGWRPLPPITGAVARSRPLRSRGSEPGDSAGALRALAVEIAARYAPMLDELPTDDVGALVGDLIDVGWVFAGQIGEPRRLAYLDRAIDLLRAEDDVTLAPVLQNTGRLRLAWTFDPVETLELIAWLRPLYERFGQPSDRLSMFYDEGTALGALGRPAEAAVALRAAIEIHHEHGGDDERHASVLTLLGVCMHECGDLAGAAGVLDDAAMIYRHLLNRSPEFASELREVLGLLVLVQSLRGEDTSAELREIARLAADLGDTDTDHIVKVVEIERAILKEGLSGLARAEQILAELRQEMERTLPPESSTLLVYLSSVSAVAIGRGSYGRPAEGLALLREAFELGDRYLPGTEIGPVRYLLLGARGQCHFAFGSVDDALHDLETAVDGLRQPSFEGSPGLDVMLYQTQFTLGRVYYATGRPAAAEDMLRAALGRLDHRSRVADTNIARGTVRSLLAFTLIEQQRFDAALEEAGEAVECLRFHTAQAPLTLADAYHAEGAALTALGRWQEALVPLQKAVGVMRSAPGDTSVLLAGLLELVGVCRVATDGLGGWPSLREGTDLMHGLRDGRWDASLMKLFPRHAGASFSRAQCHYLRDEADDALYWIIESIGALAHSPDQVVFHLLSGVLQLWVAIVNDDNEPDVEVAERQREFGAFAATLAEREPEGVPAVGLRMLAILGGMADTGRVPDEELDELDEDSSAELSEFLGLFDLDDEDDDGEAADGASESPDVAAMLQAIGPIGRVEPGASTVDIVAPAGPTAVASVSGGFEATAQRLIALGRLDLAADSLRLWAATLNATGDHAETSALMGALATLLRAVEDEPDPRFAASVAETFTELAGLWGSGRPASGGPD